VNRRIAGEWRLWRRIGRHARALGGGRRRMAIVGLASVVALVGFGLMARDWNATLDATDRANDRLDRTEAKLDRTQDDLGATVEIVDANRVALAAAIRTRLAREAERSQSQGTYDANVQWLQGLQGALDDANAALVVSTGQLDALQSCVAGATEALNQAAAGDTGGLAVTVRGIQGVCAEAGVQL